MDCLADQKSVPIANYLAYFALKPAEGCWHHRRLGRGGQAMAALTSMFKDLSASQAFGRSEA